MVLCVTNYFYYKESVSSIYSLKKLYHSLAEYIGLHIWGGEIDDGENTGLPKVTW